jgi:hypothetical protein
MHLFKCSQPDRYHRNLVERHYLRIKRIIVNAQRSLLAAAMRRRHTHLPTLALHHAAAGTLLRTHLRIRNHAGHSWHKTSYQQ